ncbi:MAG: GTPase Era [Burkholderiales bacterium]|nr:GTPase Era [Burkholderiales bacterium]
MQVVQEDFRCGYVAVIGRPNVGKSTLINALVGEKVSITSKKPQTTRNRILGVLTTENAQYIFVDTPGFQTKYSSELLKKMNQSVRTSLQDVDCIVMVIEATGWKPGDEEVLGLLDKNEKNVILAINKTDEVKESEAILPLIKESMEKFPFADVVPVSAEKDRQLNVLLDVIRKYLPVSERLFEEDTYTDKSPRFLVAEIIREKAFRLLGDELPFGIAVMIDKWEETDKLARIFATLIVTRESHKGMVIGEGGAKLREISRLARADIEKLLGKKVYLEVWVRVRKGWGDDAQALKTLGYD